MTDSLQAVERAYAALTTSAPVDSIQLAEDVLALAAALADTEDAMRMHDRQAGTFLKRAEAAEARVAELEAALTAIELLGETGGHQAQKLAKIARAALAAADRKET